MVFKKIFKETKEDVKNEFIMGVEKYFKKNKMLSDKQFDCLINWHQEKQNKDEKEWSGRWTSKKICKNKKKKFY